MFRCRIAAKHGSFAITCGCGWESPGWATIEQASTIASQHVRDGHQGPDPSLDPTTSPTPMTTTNH